MEKNQLSPKKLELPPHPPWQFKHQEVKPSKHPGCLTSMQIGYGQKNLEAFSKLPAVFLWKGWTFVL